MKHRIPVFAAEREAGIAEMVQSNASIAYYVKPEKFDASPEWIEKVMGSAVMKSTGAIGLTLDGLYPVKSILASTSWNKNDDIFDPTEVWQARYSPVNKPDNINHNEKIIVGHMIDAWPIDSEGNRIADDIDLDNLPSFYHIVNNSVIYTTWADEEFGKTVAQLIADIESGEMCVSMECVFRGFDYGVITPDGQQKIIARTKETAFLTKHLRAYQGTGSYQDHKIGRVMRNMVFSGKGYVKTPANPDSIIFSSENSTKFLGKAEINTIFEKNGVLISCNANFKENKEISDMAEDTKVLEGTVSKLEAQVAKLVEENKALAEKTAKASVDALEKSKADLAAKVEETNKSLDTVKADLEASKTAAAELAKKLEDANAAKAKLEEESSKIKTEITKATRIATLVDGGVDKVAATATVEKFAKLDDEAFAAVAELAIKAAFPPKDDKKGGKKGDMKKGDTGCAKTLENAEVEEEAALSVETDTEEGTEENTLRTAMAGYLGNFIGTGNKSSK